MSGGTSWKLESGPDGGLYDGPGGPIVLLKERDPGTTMLRMPGGVARLETDMTTHDHRRIRDGVRFAMPAGERRLRRDGKRLLLEAPEGVIASLHQGRRGRFVVEDASGREVMRMQYPNWSGEVFDGVADEHVALALAVAMSGATKTPNRWGALTPF